MIKNICYELKIECSELQYLANLQRKKTVFVEIKNLVLLILAALENIAMLWRYYLLKLIILLTCSRESENTEM